MRNLDGDRECGTGLRCVLVPGSILLHELVGGLEVRILDVLGYMVGSLGWCYGWRMRLSGGLYRWAGSCAASSACFL